MTLESTDDLDAIVTALDRHSRMPTTRIVFQAGTDAADYADAVDQIQPVSYILGEILDSEGVANATVDAYRARSQSFVDAYQSQVDIWEVGNEANGEWLARSPQGEKEQTEVADKIAAAYDVVEAQGLRSALTLSYFPSSDCRANDWEDMIWWAQNRVPEYMKQGLDYVFVSWYEDSCSPTLRPTVLEWNQVFAQLAAVFPNSRLGFGEIGTMDTGGLSLQEREGLATYYYGLSAGGILIPNFVGGYFWWYYEQEAVPFDRPNSMWPAIEAAMSKY